jgi:hypothetical protein
MSTVPSAYTITKSYRYIPSWVSISLEIVCKGRKHGLSVKIQLDLFDKMVKPILLYGCEVWGFSNNDIIEKVHLKFCKLLLHLK